MTWITPMSDDGLKYFATVKTTANVVSPFKYRIGSETFSCGKNECLISTDQFRSHMSYPVNYFWASFQTVLPDGSALGFNLGDGINS